MSPTDSTFARNLRHLKEQSGKSWPEIAADLGVRERYLFRWLGGEHEPKHANLHKLAVYFAVPEGYFFEEH
jgi:transcriptional regulator with XRE-family HTH domain